MAHGLAIDFARSHRPVSRLGAVILFAGAMIAGFSIVEYVDVSDQLDATQLKRDSLKRKTVVASSAARSPEQQAVAERLIQGASRIGRELRLPWDLLLEEIEDAVDDSVALLSLEPDAHKRQLRLSGEAKTLADALAFVARLEETESLRRPHLATQESKLSDGVRVIGFTIVADWDHPS